MGPCENTLRIVDGGLPFSILSGFDDNHRVENVVIDGHYLYDRALIDAINAIKLNPKLKLQL